MILSGRQALTGLALVLVLLAAVAVGRVEHLPAARCRVFRSAATSR
jgi:hypothetical protein